MSGCSLRSRRGVLSCRVGSDEDWGVGEEGSRSLVLGCSNRLVPGVGIGSGCVRRSVLERGTLC